MWVRKAPETLLAVRPTYWCRFCKKKALERRGSDLLNDWLKAEQDLRLHAQQRLQKSSLQQLTQAVAAADRQAPHACLSSGVTGTVLFIRVSTALC